MSRMHVMFKVLRGMSPESARILDQIKENLGARTVHVTAGDTDSYGDFGMLIELEVPKAVVALLHVNGPAFCEVANDGVGDAWQGVMASPPEFIVDGGQ